MKEETSMPTKSSFKFTPTLFLTTFLACFGSSMLYGYNLAVVNLPEKYIECFFKKTLLNNSTCVFDGSEAFEATDEKAKFLFSLINTAFVVAGAIGAFLTGAIADNIGRRNGLIFNHIFMIIGGLLMLPCQQFQAPLLLYIGRFCIGLNCGVTIGLASMYMTEIAPTPMRGFIGACHQLAVTIGIVVGYVMTTEQFFNQPALWPIAFFLTMVPAVISLIFMPMFCPESPRFLYMNKSDVEGAKTAFFKVNAIEDVDEFIAEIEGEIKSQANQKQFSFLQIFTRPSLRMPLIIACLIQVMQQLSGINAVVTYSGIMLTRAGVPTQLLQYCVIAIGVLNVVCTIVSLPLLETFGRKTLLLWPSVLIMFSLIALTVFTTLGVDKDDSTKHIFGLISLAFILLYMTGFAFGLGPVPGLIVSELFRQESRGVAYSVSQCIQWISNLIVMTVYPYMESIIKGYSFLTFFFVVLFCWLFFLKYMPETKGKTFEEISKELEFGKKYEAEADVVANPEDVLT